MTSEKTSADRVVEKKIVPMIEKIAQKKRVREKMARVKHKIMIMSGKGGVGKSTITANLAAALAKRGYRVGILDSDIHGPSIPKILGIQGKHPQKAETGITPLTTNHGVKVISMDLFLSSSEDPLIWRGPLKMKAIRQLLSDVDWGELDYLLVDLPPGTGDEPINIAQLMPEMDGALIITAPSALSQHVVRKAVTMAQRMRIPIVGIIENMSGFRCPNCGTEIYLFGKDGGQKAAEELNIPFLGRIPMDPEIVKYEDRGKPFIIEREKTEAAKAFFQIVERIQERLENE